MSILIFAFVVILITALVCWIINTAPIISPNFKWALQAIAVIIAVLVIVQRSGIA